MTPKKSCKDRSEPDSIVVSDGMVRKIYLIWYKSFVNKLFHQLTSVLRWLINVSFTITFYQMLTLADKL